MAIEITSPMAGDKLKTELEKALDKTGDSMADGASLILGKMPETDMEAVPKKYVDNFADYLYRNTDLFIKRDENGNVLYTDYEEVLGEEQSVIGAMDVPHYELPTPKRLCEINFSKYSSYRQKIIVELIGHNTFYKISSSSRYLNYSASAIISLRDKDGNTILTKKAEHPRAQYLVDPADKYYPDGVCFFSNSSPAFTIDKGDYKNESLYLWLDGFEITAYDYDVTGFISLSLKSVKLSVDDRWEIDFGKTVI